MIPADPKEYKERKCSSLKAVTHEGAIWISPPCCLPSDKVASKRLEDQWIKGLASIQYIFGRKA